MKVLNSGDIIHSSYYVFDTPVPINRTRITDRGYSILSIVQNVMFSDLMFRIGSDIISMITRLYHRSIGGGYWPVHLHTILISSTAFRKGAYQAYWRIKQKTWDWAHSESTANAVSRCSVPIGQSATSVACQECILRTGLLTPVIFIDSDLCVPTSANLSSMLCLSQL